MDAQIPLRALLLASRKGGAGKTTLALHLGVVLGERSKVLLIDADEQASASAWYRMRAASEPRLVACQPRQVRDVLDAARAEGIGLAIIDTAGKAEVEYVMRLADFVLIPVRTAFLERANQFLLRVPEAVLNHDRLQLAQERPGIRTKRRNGLNQRDLVKSV